MGFQKADEDELERSCAVILEDVAKQMQAVVGAEGTEDRRKCIQRFPPISAIQMQIWRCAF